MVPEPARHVEGLSERYLNSNLSQDVTNENSSFAELPRVAYQKAHKMFPEAIVNDNESEGSAKIMKVLRKIRQHSFNVFKLSKATKKPLKVLFLASVNDFDLVSKLQLPSDKLESLADDLQATYNINHYHSAVHAADMTQNATYILHRDGLGDALSPLVLFAVLLAAAGHDAAHCGIKNDAVLVKAHGLVQIFGVNGSQEHMHAEVTCCLLLKSGLLEGRGADVADACRVVQQLILATDMGRHSEVNSYAACEEIQQAIAAHGLVYAKWDEPAQLMLCCLMLHWADLSNVARRFDVSAAFAVLLGHEQSPAGAAKGSAAAAAAAATAMAAADTAAGKAAQAAAGAAIAAAVIASSRSGQVSEQQLTLEQLVQEQEVAAVANAQVGFMVNFAASTLGSLAKVLPKAAAEAQQHFSSNLARWEAIINNSSSAAAS